MADDTKGHEAGADPVGSSGEKVIADAVSPVTAIKPARRTDWTASDARGPLNEAPPVADAAVEEPPHAAGIEPPPSTPPVEPSPAIVGAAAAEVPRRSMLPLAAAVVVGAMIGAGSAFLVYRWQYAATGSLDQTVAQLSGRVDALATRPDPQQAIATLKTSVSTLDTKVAALQKPGSAAPVAAVSTASRSTIGSTPNAVSAASGPAPGTSLPPAATPASAPQLAPIPAFDPVPLQLKITALQATLDGLQTQAAAAKALEAKVGSLQTSVDGLRTQTDEVRKQTSAMQKQTSEVEKQASGAQAGIEAIQGQQKSFEGRISAPALAVVADSLVQRIDQGQPYDQQVDALATLGADPAQIAVLRENARKGVPSAKALAAQFKPLAEPILATEHKVAPNASVFERLKSGMSGLVSVRNTSDTTGDGLDARVSRIEADLTHNDVTGAYTTWRGLPADAKAKSDAWGASVKSAAEANDAARALQQGAIAALGGRKS